MLCALAKLDFLILLIWHLANTLASFQRWHFQLLALACLPINFIIFNYQLNSHTQLEAVTLHYCK